MGYFSYSKAAASGCVSVRLRSPGVRQRLRVLTRCPIRIFVLVYGCLVSLLQVFGSYHAGFLAQRVISLANMVRSGDRHVSAWYGNCYFCYVKVMVING